MLARPCCAVEPTKRNDSVVPSAAVAGAANAAVGEEATAPSAAVDYEELNKALENASPLEIMDRALDMFGNEIAIAFRLKRASFLSPFLFLVLVSGCNIIITVGIQLHVSGSII